MRSTEYLQACARVPVAAVFARCILFLLGLEFCSCHLIFPYAPAEYETVRDGGGLDGPPDARPIGDAEGSTGDGLVRTDALRVADIQAVADDAFFDRFVSPGPWWDYDGATLRMIKDYVERQVRCLVAPTRMLCDVCLYEGVLKIDYDVARAAHDDRLNYDVQVKVATGWEIEHGAVGISFRRRGDPGAEHYGVSFLKHDGSGSDHLPDDLKVDIPPDTLFLVLWHQTLAGGLAPGAFQVLARSALDGDACVKGPMAAHDGRLLHDFTSLMLRVWEDGPVGDRNTYLRVYYGDDNSFVVLPSVEGPDRYQGTPLVCKDRQGDTDPYDIAGGRLNYEVISSVFPIWPSFAAAGWLEKFDVFTMIGRSSWEVVANRVAVADDGTIVLRGVGSPASLPSDHGEVALHAMGQWNDTKASTTVSFADFALRFFH